MRAAVGDRIVIASNSLDRPVRDGRVVELRHPDGSPPYVVEWSGTGQTALVFPGPDARVEPASGAAVPEAPVTRHVRTWRIDVQLFESDAETTAHAVLTSGGAEPLRGDGHARRREGEPDVPEIGDEIAVGRALHRLGDRLLAAASGDLSAISGHETRVRG
jgi:Domain of unknown function (DUF1876)/Domain of unknown function (DUF1918)